MRARLEAMIALTETAGCRTRALLACFGEELGRDCGHCDNCVAPVGTFDGTVEAQKVLSAVWRTGQRFGVGHVVSVLLGKATDMVAHWHHDSLPTFGIGADHDEGFWRSVIRQLIARGAMGVEVDEPTRAGRFSHLSLDAERARPILRGEERVILREDLVRANGAEGTRGAGGAGEASGGARMPPGSRRCASWRLAEARAQGRATLRDLPRQRAARHRRRAAGAIWTNWAR